MQLGFVGTGTMGNPMGMREEVLREVEQFLYREARVLDDRRFHEWLELFTDDVRYWMAARSSRYPRASKAIATMEPDRHRETALTKEDDLAILDETKATLGGRIARLDTGIAWAEDPPSRTRHIIANIEVEAGDSASELKVYSNFMVYRHRWVMNGGHQNPNQHIFTSIRSFMETVAPALCGERPTPARHDVRRGW